MIKSGFKSRAGYDGAYTVYAFILRYVVFILSKHSLFKSILGLCGVERGCATSTKAA